VEATKARHVDHDSTPQERRALPTLCPRRLAEIADLTLVEKDRVLAVVAVYPAEQETGFLEEQGATIERFSDEWRRRVPTAALGRLLWSQVATFVTGLPFDEVVERVRDALCASRRSAIELRALVLAIHSQDGIEELEVASDELSSRRNFGTSPAKVTRLIVPWADET